MWVVVFLWLHNAINQRNGSLTNIHSLFKWIKLSPLHSPSVSCKTLLSVNSSEHADGSVAVSHVPCPVRSGKFPQQKGMTDTELSKRRIPQLCCRGYLFYGCVWYIHFTPKKAKPPGPGTDGHYCMMLEYVTLPSATHRALCGSEAKTQNNNLPVNPLWCLVT